MLFMTAQGALNHLNDAGIQREQINTGMFTSFGLDSGGILASGTIADSRCGAVEYLYPQIIPHRAIPDCDAD